MKKDNPELPVVFACAGASEAGQLAYKIALEMDRRGIAEMSCLAGLAAGKRPFLKKIKNRSLWIIDGCPIECANALLEETWHDDIRHICLHDFGIKKTDKLPDDEEFDVLMELIVKTVNKTYDALQSH